MIFKINLIQIEGDNIISIYAKFNRNRLNGF